MCGFYISGESSRILELIETITDDHDAILKWSHEFSEYKTRKEKSRIDSLLHTKKVKNRYEHTRRRSNQ